ncbi:MAG: hypothetical protein U9N32_08710, partial [Spirochaetota bacterium]|nr:hypothetical protein [Spirochaetota bacterium]
MSTTVFINALELTDFAYKNLPGGESSFTSALNFASKLPDVGNIVVLAGPNFSKVGDFKVVYPQGSDMKDLISVFIDESGDAENIFYFYGDTPFLDLTIT